MCQLLHLLSLELGVSGDQSIKIHQQLALRVKHIRYLDCGDGVEYEILHDRFLFGKLLELLDLFLITRLQLAFKRLQFLYFCSLLLESDEEGFL